jgi:hypothetical protein
VQRGPVERRQVPDVAELTVGLDVGEGRQRVPDRRGPHALADRRTASGSLIGSVGTVGLDAGLDVVGPGNVVLVQQVGQVGPGIGAEFDALAATASCAW